MAKPVSYTKTPEDDDVILEMVEPSFQAKRASETTGLYFERAGSNKKVDYVLVYERCEEKENEDEESKEKAQKLEGMRTAFEESLKKAGLIIERVERVSSQVSSYYALSKFQLDYRSSHNLRLAFNFPSLLSNF